jgi:hypothetical protein
MQYGSTRERVPADQSEDPKIPDGRIIKDDD